jgi:transcriptional regulator with XRE-family HTH domain
LSPPLKDAKKSFGRAVRTLRVQAGLSQEEVALKGGIHPTHVSLLEKGRGNPTQKTVEGLARGIGVSPSRITSLAEAFVEISKR